MTKKGYQKRLPTVTPPPPAAPPAGRAPAPPAPRRAPGAESVARPPVEARPVVAPVRSRWSPATLVKGAAVVATVLGLAVLAFVVVGAIEDRPEAPLPATEDTAFAPRMLAADESFIETRVLENGDVVVRQWIRAAEPLRRLRIALPDLPGDAALSATEIEVVAEGSTADGPTSLASGAATYTFDEATDVEVRYRFTGGVERSASAQGRALALATTLDVRYSPQVERETRVVRAPAVLSLACASSAEVSPVPCGRAYGDNQWRVDLLGPRVLDRVLAQLTLG